MAIPIGTGAARAALFESGSNGTVYESNSINPDTDANSLIVVTIAHVSGNGSEVIDYNSFTFGDIGRDPGEGTAMTVEVNSTDVFNNFYAIIAWLKTDATGTVLVDSDIDLRGAIIDVMQLKGVDQTDPVPTNADEQSTSTSGNDIDLTTEFDNSWLVANSSSQGSDTGPPNNSNGTNLHQGSTGTTGFSDTKDAASYREIASAGAETANFTWGSSIDTSQAAIEVKAAAVGVVLFLRPDGDDTDGRWTNENNGLVLFSSIDEVVADDSDHIRSGDTPAADICKISLSNPVEVDANGAHTIRYRYRKDAVSNPLDLTVRLVQGVTTIASWNHTNIGESVVEAEQTLTAGQRANITDYDDLFFEFEADQP